MSQSIESKRIKAINQQMVELSKGIGADNPYLAKYVNALKLAGVEYKWRETPQVDGIAVPTMRNTKENQQKIKLVELYLKQSKAQNKKQVREQIQRKLEKRGVKKPTQKTISMELEIESLKKDVMNRMDVKYKESGMDAPNTYDNTNFILDKDKMMAREWEFEFQKITQGIKDLELLYRTGEITFQDLKDNFQNIKDYIDEIRIGNSYAQDDDSLFNMMKGTLRNV